jgi:hypothetical protein
LVYKAPFIIFPFYHILWPYFLFYHILWPTWSLDQLTEIWFTPILGHLTSKILGALEIYTSKNLTHLFPHKHSKALPIIITLVGTHDKCGIITPLPLLNYLLSNLHMVPFSSSLRLQKSILKEYRVKALCKLLFLIYF